MSQAQPAPAMEPGLVLIVDDEAAIAEVLADVVRDLGFTPLLAANGRQALDLALRRWPALVVTDLMMPQMSGAELMVTLRKEAAGRHLRPPAMLVLTAGGARATADICADAILYKPFELEALERTVHALMNSSHG